MISLDIVTPTLNSSQTLRSTLDSIAPLIKLGATHTIVDSGSTDGTLEIARNSDARVIYCPPGNMYEAINMGFLTSSSEWITYINCDDLLYSDAVLHAFSLYAAKADLIYGNLDFINSFGRFLYSRRSPSPTYLPFLMKYYSCIPQMGTIFRRRLFNELGGFDEGLKFVADRDFFHRCIMTDANVCKYRHSTIGAFRISASQMSHKHYLTMTAEGQQSRAKNIYQTSSVGRIGAHLMRRLLNIDNYLLQSARREPSS